MARARQDWTRKELTAIVDDYFEMLKQEAAGEPFNKSRHNAALRERLNGRSKGAVEFKHQNISAVLLSLNLPWISGYKPAGHFQDDLREYLEG